MKDKIIQIAISSYMIEPAGEAHTNLVGLGESGELYTFDGYSSTWQHKASSPLLIEEQ